MSSYDGRTLVPVTSNFVKMSNGCIQGSYIDLPMRRNASRITIELNGAGSYAGLSEVELYESGQDVFER